MVRQPQSDYDSPWKEALDLYFEDFIAFFFPEAHSDINWQRNYESLDTELQEVVRDAETGRRLADKLVKVWLQSGEETWLLVHIEIQSKADSDFGKRMYVYNHRLFDRYDREVVSLAVLGDDQQNWRPTGYGYAKWGFESSLQFPVVKLLDYQQRWSELEQSLNPFAIIVMAHLKTQATRRDSQGRLQWKLSLARGLQERGYTREQIFQLLRLISWMMVLPRDLERSYKAEMKRYQEENRMPYLTIFEEDAMVQVTREYILEVLETRFQAVPQGLSDRINEIDDLALLKSLHKRAITVASVEEFEQVIASI